MQNFSKTLASLCAVLGCFGSVNAMTWSGDPGPWGPGPMTDCINTWNTYSSYGFNIPVYYNAGIPTAQSDYRGSIGFGAQGNYRVAMHESSHWMGTGTTGEWGFHQRFSIWNGTYATNLRRAYDGPGERQFIYGVHYGPQGANYDSEGVQGPQMVGIIGAFRRDQNMESGDQTIGIASGTYRLRQRAAVKVLENAATTAEGAQVRQNENGPSNSQLWNVALRTGTKYFTIQNSASGKYLDTLGATANGAAVGLKSLAGTTPTDAQLWEIVQTDSFFFKIVNKANGRGLDNLGATGNGDGISQWDASGNSSLNQQWTFMHAMPQLAPKAGVVSQGRPVASSSTQDNNYDAKGNNGVAGDRWTASSGSFPQWWRVDTGIVQPITKVEIDWFNTGAPTFQYRIEVSDNDSTWTVAADRTSNTVSGTTVDQVTASGRFVRVTITGASAGYAAFYECRVFNETTPMRNLSQHRPVSANSEQTGNLAVNANDVDPVFTRWCSNSSGYPGWWQVDLGAVKQVNKAVIAWFDDDARYYQYKIEGSTDGTTFTTLADRTGNTQPYTTADTFSGLARFVRITVTGGSSGYPSIYDAQFFGATTLAPANLTASVSGQNIALSWTAAAGATSYNVKRATTTGGPYTTVASAVTVTGYTDSTATAGKAYYYVVSSVNDANEGEQTAETRATTQGTLAFWNFEDGVNGRAFTPAGSANGTGGSVDIANGTLMRGYDANLGPSWTSATPPNGGSLAMSNADNHQDGYVTEGPLHGWSPTAWTIECTVFLEEISGWKTLLGRDGSSQGDTQSDFYLQKNGIDNKFRINIDTVGGQRWILDGNYTAQANTWYALAARSDGSTLSLWLDDGTGYKQIGSLDISSQSVAQNALPGTTLNWTFGRGWFNGGLVDKIDGRMDNIRFTTGALAPAQLITRSALTPVQAWRFAYFGTTANTGDAADDADPDGDGWNNASEFASATNPTDRNSLLKITDMAASGSNYVISFPSVVGRHYSIQYSTTLSADWQPVMTDGTPATGIPGTGGVIQVTDTGGADQQKRFYRIWVQP